LTEHARNPVPRRHEEVVMNSPITHPHSEIPPAGERDRRAPAAAEPELKALDSPPLADFEISDDDLERLEHDIEALQSSRMRPLREMRAPQPREADPVPDWVRRVDPELRPRPPRPRRRDFSFGFFARMGVVVLVGGIGTLVVLGKIPANGWQNAKAELIRLASAAPWGRAASKPRTAATTPALVLEGSTTESGDAILLGVKVAGPVEGAIAVISGLAPGTTLTAGQPSGPNGWLLSAAELQNTFIRPPQGFAGTMQYAIELHLDDGTLVDRQSMLLDWPEATTTTTLAAAPRTIDDDELALLMKRGQGLIETGDLSGARLLLKRAAEAGSARAAFALGATYDPLVLKEIGVVGFASDVAMARTWYEKAKEMGSREAPRRLELLASHSR
jgi:hypothetical protein